MENLERYLAEHPFFRDLPPRYLPLIVGCASNVYFDPGEFLFREGQEANAFYLIRHGQVALEINSPSRGPIIIQMLNEGEVAGFSWLIPPYLWRFDARATGLVRATALDGRCLRAKCEADHDLGYELLKRFSTILEERLQSTRLQLLDVYSNPS
ncbi:MAG TPA: cyclic nucleotide-binding domain-containing protein [Chthonomonadaceae bacterium]|nr:cyclic nucleotide-binding domain-containing protein [Chthonomonadaceae bacterium]